MATTMWRKRKRSKCYDQANWCWLLHRSISGILDDLHAGCLRKCGENYVLPLFIGLVHALNLLDAFYHNSLRFARMQLLPGSLRFRFSSASGHPPLRHPFLHLHPSSIHPHCHFTCSITRERALARWALFFYLLIHKDLQWLTPLPPCFPTRAAFDLATIVLQYCRLSSCRTGKWV